MVSNVCDLQTKHLEFNSSVPAVWFNLTTMVGSNKITDGSHDNADLIRTATISQKHKIMTLTINQKAKNRNASISISFESESSVVEFTFNITIEKSEEEASLLVNSTGNTTAVIANHSQIQLNQTGVYAEHQDNSTAQPETSSTIKQDTTSGTTELTTTNEIADNSDNQGIAQTQTLETTTITTTTTTTEAKLKTSIQQQTEASNQQPISTTSTQTQHESIDNENAQGGFEIADQTNHVSDSDKAQQEAQNVLNDNTQHPTSTTHVLTTFNNRNDEDPEEHVESVTTPAPSIKHSVISNKNKPKKKQQPQKKPFRIKRIRNRIRNISNPSQKIIGMGF